MAPAMFEPKEEQKKELINQTKTKTNEFLESMQNVIEKNGREFMVGKKVSRFLYCLEFIIYSIIKR